MKKLIIFVLVITLVFAFAGIANAATIPAGSITLSAEIIDYVSALSGIAKPTNIAYKENERFAVLVRVDIPQWYDTSNMKVDIKQNGAVLDSFSGVAVATGNYLLYGTLYSTSGSITITLQDNAIYSANTTQALWAALYGDRTVSATVNFMAAAAVPATGTILPTAPVLEIPSTGGAPVLPVSLGMFVLGVLLIAVRRKRLNA